MGKRQVFNSDLSRYEKDILCQDFQSEVPLPDWICTKLSYAQLKMASSPSKYIGHLVRLYIMIGSLDNFIMMGMTSDNDFGPRKCINTRTNSAGRFLTGIKDKFIKMIFSRYEGDQGLSQHL